VRFPPKANISDTQFVFTFTEGNGEGNYFLSRREFNLARM